MNDCVHMLAMIPLYIYPCIAFIGILAQMMIECTDQICVIFKGTGTYGRNDQARTLRMNFLNVILYTFDNTRLFGDAAANEENIRVVYVLHIENLDSCMIIGLIQDVLHVAAAFLG